MCVSEPKLKNDLESSDVVEKQPAAYQQSLHLLNGHRNERIRTQPSRTDRSRDWSGSHKKRGSKRKENLGQEVHDV
jgi:hypothetical protein